MLLLIQLFRKFHKWLLKLVLMQLCMWLLMWLLMQLLMGLFICCLCSCLCNCLCSCLSGCLCSCLCCFLLLERLFWDLRPLSLLFWGKERQRRWPQQLIPRRLRFASAALKIYKIYNEKISGTDMLQWPPFPQSTSYLHISPSNSWHCFGGLGVDWCLHQQIPCLNIYYIWQTLSSIT